jgi:hypothetical protein
VIPVLESAAGLLRFPALRFAAEGRRRARCRVALGENEEELPLHTEIARPVEVRPRARLPITVAIQDVSEFAKGAHVNDVHTIAVIGSHELPEMDRFYRGTLLLQVMPRRIPQCEAMVHPITLWRQPQHLAIHAFEIAIDW